MMSTPDRFENLAARVEALLPRVEKPARYLDHEIHAIHREWTPETVKWLLILPEIYEIGMSHLGLRLLYDILNRRADALAERAFAPWVDMEDRMRAARIPLFALESRRPAQEFDIVGFSLQYELLATNVVNLLDLAGIPIWSRERGPDDPFIAAGGPSTANPEPLADLFDFVLIGDGEEAVGRITERLAASRGRPRRERLRELAEIPGVYVPSCYEPVYAGGRQVGVRPIDGAPLPIRRTFVESLDALPYPERPIIPLITAVQDRLTLEIQRGCTQGCRFCQAGIFYRPVRERSPERLVELAACGLEASGYDEINLASLSSADYTQILPLARVLAEALKPARTGISLPSLRLDTFSVELAELVARVRKTSLTFAPEAGTQRLRDVINKRVREEDLYQAIEAAYARGWQRVKLYFMVGLPTETQADLDGLVDCVRRVREIGRRFGRTRSVTVSIGTFVPKAHTPFQWEAFEDRERLRGKIAFLRGAIHSPWSPVKWHDVEPSFIEAVLARGDRRLARVVARVREKGARFDGWTEHFQFDRWSEVFRESGIDPVSFTAARDPREPLPWDHIDLGVSREWLRREREHAMRGAVTDDCRSGRCTMCGMGGPRDRKLAADLDPVQWDALRARLSEAVRATAAPPLPVSMGAPPLPLRYRLVFSKTGPLRFISHLETGTLLLRLLRMARWPLAYTQGHNPHPRVAFGPPLPLGVEGARELLDVYLVAPPETGALARLNEVAPRGLRFREASEIPFHAPSLTVEMVAATYRVTLPPDLAEQARRERRVEAFLDAGTRIVSKPSKGRQKSVDLKRCLVRLEWTSPDAADAALLLEAWLVEPGGHTLAPAALLREIFAWDPESLARCRVRRLEFRSTPPPSRSPSA
jgi:radical SAM family uncharacterized protein/radical SAM-linked protein